MFQELNGPSRQFKKTLDTIAPQKLRKNAEALPERKVITIQAMDGKAWIYFADEGEVPSATDVSTKGFLHFTKGKESYEASNTQVVWALAFSGTVDLRGAERA